MFTEAHKPGVTGFCLSGGIRLLQPKELSRKKNLRIAYHVEVEVSDVPPGFEELELDHLGTVATYVDVTPPQLAQLVETINAVDPAARIEVFQYLARGGKRIYRGDCNGCLAAVMAASGPVQRSEGSRA